MVFFQIFAAFCAGVGRLRPGDPDVSGQMFRWSRAVSLKTNNFFHLVKCNETLKNAVEVKTSENAEVEVKHFSTRSPNLTAWAFCKKNKTQKREEQLWRETKLWALPLWPLWSTNFIFKCIVAKVSTFFSTWPINNIGTDAGLYNWHFKKKKRYIKSSDQHCTERCSKTHVRFQKNYPHSKKVVSFKTGASSRTSLHCFQ